MEFEKAEERGAVLGSEDVVAVGVARDEFFSYVLRYGRALSRFFAISASIRKGRTSTAGIALRMEEGIANEVATVSVATAIPDTTEATLLDVPFYSYDKLVQLRHMKI